MHWTDVWHPPKKEFPTMTVLMTALTALPALTAFTAFTALTALTSYSYNPSTGDAFAHHIFLHLLSSSVFLFSYVQHIFLNCATFSLYYRQWSIDICTRQGLANITVCLYVCLPVCLNACMYVCLSVCSYGISTCVRMDETFLYLLTYKVCVHKKWNFMPEENSMTITFQ